MVDIRWVAKYVIQLPLVLLHRKSIPEPRTHQSDATKKRRTPQLHRKEVITTIPNHNYC